MINKKNIKKVEAICHGCGKIGRIEISDTVEMTEVIFQFFERQLTDWAISHCARKPDLVSLVNNGMGTWKGKMLIDMSRQELIDAVNELGELYKEMLEKRL